MNGPFMGTLKSFVHSSQNRYLDGIDVTPNSLFGKRRYGACVGGSKTLKILHFYKFL